MKVISAIVGGIGLASALQSGIAPATQGRVSKVEMSRFTGKVWDIEAKKAILEEWDPEEKRGYDNFNPFERDSVGNACDTNGKFPGETAYKDPIRADTSFAQMQADRAAMEVINADPKMKITGKPGNWKFGWDEGLGSVP